MKSSFKVKVQSINQVDSLAQSNRDIRLQLQRTWNSWATSFISVCPFQQKKSFVGYFFPSTSNSHGHNKSQLKHSYEVFRFSSVKHTTCAFFSGHSQIIWYTSSFTFIVNKCVYFTATSQILFIWFILTYLIGSSSRLFSGSPLKIFLRIPMHVYMLPRYLLDTLQYWPPVLVFSFMASPLAKDAEHSLVSHCTFVSVRTGIKAGAQSGLLFLFIPRSLHRETCHLLLFQPSMGHPPPHS